MSQSETFQFDGVEVTWRDGRMYVEDDIEVMILDDKLLEVKKVIEWFTINHPERLAEISLPDQDEKRGVA